MIPRTLWNNLVVRICNKFPAALMSENKWNRLERVLRSMCRYGGSLR